MKRKDTYFVGGENARFTNEDWLKLEAASKHFYKCFPDAKPDTYRVGVLHTNEVRWFYVSRTDHKLFVVEELKALHAFFLGVMAIGNITPQIKE